MQYQVCNFLLTMKWSEKHIVKHCKSIWVYNVFSVHLMKTVKLVAKRPTFSGVSARYNVMDIMNNLNGRTNSEKKQRKVKRKGFKFQSF